MSAGNSDHVPLRQHNGLLVAGFGNVIGHPGTGHDDLVDVFIEPRVVHREESLAAHLVTPGVLNPPAHRDIVNQINPDEGHGVSATGFTQPQPFSLRHVHVDAVEGLVVMQLRIPDAQVFVELLLDIAGEPHRLTVSN